jgi:putative transposase
MAQRGGTIRRDNHTISHIDAVMAMIIPNPPYGNTIMPFDPKRHGRRSIRLAGYDYTQAGAYFVTICTQERRPLLATIDAAGHTLTPIGKLIARCWLALPRHFPHVALDAWVLMPDHMHGIVVMRDTDAPSATSSANQPNGTRPGSLNAAIQNFKSVSTRKINQVRQTPGAIIWQRNYYERIIRDESAFEHIRRYIENNPAKWHD